MFILIRYVQKGHHILLWTYCIFILLTISNTAPPYTWSKLRFANTNVTLQARQMLYKKNFINPFFFKKNYQSNKLYSIWINRTCAPLWPVWSTLTCSTYFEMNSTDRLNSTWIWDIKRFVLKKIYHFRQWTLNNSFCVYINKECNCWVDVV